jgi:hypothetical protein
MAMNHVFGHEGAAFQLRSAILDYFGIKFEEISMSLRPWPRLTLPRFANEREIGRGLRPNFEILANSYQA